VEIDSISEAGGRPTLTFVTLLVMDEGYKNRRQVACAIRSTIGRRGNVVDSTDF